MFSRKTLLSRNPWAEPPLTTTIPPRARRPEAPRCLYPKSVRSCAAARARAGADNTAPLRVNRSFARTRIMAWGACSARTPNESESDACRQSHCTGTYIGSPRILRNRTACGSWMTALSRNSIQMIVTCTVWACRRYVDTPSALGANASYMRQGGGVSRRVA